MQIQGPTDTRDVRTSEQLRNALSERDRRGGAQFFLVAPEAQYPWIGMRVSGTCFDIHYFPHDDHPGFRCLRDGTSDGDCDVLFQFDGCDPGDGEVVPASFVVGIERAIEVAEHFMRTQGIRDPRQWLEL